MTADDAERARWKEFREPGRKAAAPDDFDLDEGDTAWHAGNREMNCRSIGIEIICIGEDFSVTEIAKASWLTQRLREKNVIPDANVIRRYNDTGKRCPAPYLDASK